MSRQFQVLLSQFYCFGNITIKETFQEYETQMNRLTKWLIELDGMKIWPPTHNDPRIKGPQPRILTRRQWEAMEKMRRERENEESGNDVEAQATND